MFTKLTVTIAFIMRYFYILMLLSVQLSFSQISDNDKADILAASENYSEEIKLRTSIIKTISDQNSESYKEQLYSFSPALFIISSKSMG